jgi:hypothetical protein
MALEFLITASTTDFLLNVPNAAAQGTDNFILQINRVQRERCAVYHSRPEQHLRPLHRGHRGRIGESRAGEYLGLWPRHHRAGARSDDNDGTPSVTWNPATRIRDGT